LVVEKIKITKSREYVKYLDYAIKNSTWEGSLVQAALGYAEIPSKDNLTQLSKLINYEEGTYNSFVRIAAAKSLANHKYKESEQLLLDRLKVEKTIDVIKIIINSLSILGYESSIESLSNFFTHSNYNIVLIAFDTVSKIGGEKAEEAILEYVRNNPDGRGYDVAVTILQLRMNLDRKQILKETNPAKYYFEEAQDNFIEAKNQTNTALKRRYYSRAIENINKSLNYNPNYAKAYFLRGSCFFNLEQYEDAKKDLETAIDIGIVDNDIYMALGIINYNLGNFDKAEEYFNEYLVKTNQSDPTVYLRIAKTQASNGKYEEAINSVNLYLFSYPDDPQAIKTLADIYHLKGDWLNAIENMEIYLESYPNDIDAIYSLGIEYINYGELDKGIERMLQIIDMVQTDYPRVYYFLGLAYMKKTDYDNAKKYLEYFIEIADPVEDAPFIKKARIMIGKIEDLDDVNNSD
jgi:tetratricopeptide (TPR) repeat protein